VEGAAHLYLPANPRHLRSSEKKRIANAAILASMGLSYLLYVDERQKRAHGEITWIELTNLAPQGTGEV
jgi:hypothetical protein